MDVAWPPQTLARSRTVTRNLSGWLASVAAQDCRWGQWRACDTSGTKHTMPAAPAPTITTCLRLSVLRAEPFEDAEAIVWLWGDDSDSQWILCRVLETKNDQEAVRNGVSMQSDKSKRCVVKMAFWWRKASTGHGEARVSTSCTRHANGCWPERRRHRALARTGIVPAAR